ncbi:MAG: phosphoribosylformylglycinamidine synthase subunit PurQ [Nitrospinota bacterium]
MRFGVVVFPGSNCDHDCYHVVKHVLDAPVEFVWHKERSLAGFDCVVLPGGFSYGDYLRAGAIARFSPIMRAVERFAGEGGVVIGICNGFQVLCEAKLLPGALVRNRTLRFICSDVHIRVETARTPFTAALRPGEVLHMPIAHAEGCYVCDPRTLRALEANDQVVFRYCDPGGGLGDEANPNSSLAHIAGICNREGNVLGMMPHPERAAESALGSADGLVVFRSALERVGA